MAFIEVNHFDANKGKGRTLVNTQAIASVTEMLSEGRMGGRPVVVRFVDGSEIIVGEEYAWISAQLKPDEDADLDDE